MKLGAEWNSRVIERIVLFDLEPTNAYEPLPVRMRPTKLDHLYGQRKAVGRGIFLRAMVEKDTIPSMLLYGPCGTGKTTLDGYHC